MFLLNMLVAIIIAHYAEYEEQQVLIQRSMNDHDANFFKLMFILLRNAIAPNEFRNSQSSLKRMCYRKLKQLERWLVAKKTFENPYEEEIKELKSQLSSKYRAPNYKQKKDLHYYLMPYLQTKIDDQVKTTAAYQLTESPGGDDFVNIAMMNEEGGDLLGQKSPLELPQGPLKQAERQNQWIDRYPEAKAFRDLKVGIFKDFQFEGNNQDMLTSTTIWLAALEEELFHISNYKILYTDLLENQDAYHREEIVKIYNVNEFNTLQASFLAAITLRDQITIWKKANIEQKSQIWEIMDFNKLIEDQNKIQSDDTLEDFFEFYNQTQVLSKPKQKSVEKLTEIQQKRKMMDFSEKKELKSVSKPILTFKKINKSPEYQNHEYSRASNTQRFLWLKHTSQKERFQLWFQKFNSYYRVKLWNRLQFSEDYALNFCNSQQFSRQDLLIFVLEKLDDVRTEYIEHLMNKYESLLIKKQAVINVNSQVPAYKKVLERIEDVETKFIQEKNLSLKSNQYTNIEKLLCLQLIQNEQNFIIAQNLVLSSYQLFILQNFNLKQYILKFYKGENQTKLIQITQRKMRLQEIIKMVPNTIKDKHITSEFYLKIWKLIKLREYEEILPKAGQSIIDVIRKVRNGVKYDDDSDKNKQKQKGDKSQQEGGLTIIDKFDVDESKDLRPKENFKNALGVKTPNIFSPPPEKETTFVNQMGFNIERAIRSKITSKLPSAQDSGFNSRRGSVIILGNRPASTEPRVNLLDLRLRAQTPDSNQPLQSPKKIVHFMFGSTKAPTPDWLGRPADTGSQNQFTDEKFLLTSPLQTERNEEDLERGGKPKLDSLQGPKLFAKLQLTLKAQALNQQSRLKRRNSGLALLHQTKKVKLGKQTHLMAMKRLFQLMVHGQDGEMLKTMNKLCQQKIDVWLEDKNISSLARDDPRRVEKIEQQNKQFKYNYVIKNYSAAEERLALWLPLSLEEKSMMINAQHIDEEAEIMEMLLLEEIDWFGKGIYKLEELDTLIERGLDNLIYEKYQKITENQSLDMVKLNLENVMQIQLEQDIVLLRYMTFLEEKQRMLGISANLASKNMRRLKDENKRIAGRIKWNKQFNEKNKKNGQPQNLSSQKTSPWKLNKRVNFI